MLLPFGRYKHPPLEACKEIIWQELQCMKGYDITYFPLECDDCLVIETSSFQALSTTIEKIQVETGMSMDFQGLDNGKISIFFCRERLDTDKEHGIWLKKLQEERGSGQV